MGCVIMMHDEKIYTNYNIFIKEKKVVRDMMGRTEGYDIISINMLREIVSKCEYVIAYGLLGRYNKNVEGYFNFDALLDNGISLDKFDMVKFGRPNLAMPEKQEDINKYITAWESLQEMDDFHSRFGAITRIPLEICKCIHYAIPSEKRIEHIEITKIKASQRIIELDEILEKEYDTTFIKLLTYIRMTKEPKKTMDPKLQRLYINYKNAKERRYSVLFSSNKALAGLAAGFMVEEGIWDVDREKFGSVTVACSTLALGLKNNLSQKEVYDQFEEKNRGDYNTDEIKKLRSKLFGDENIYDGGLRDTPEFLIKIYKIIESILDKVPAVYLRRMTPFWWTFNYDKTKYTEEGVLEALREAAEDTGYGEWMQIEINKKKGDA